MCKHSSHYSIHDNLVNWFCCYAIVAVLSYLSRQPGVIDDYTTTWAAGAGFGMLFAWSLEIGREWVKTWRVT